MSVAQIRTRPKKKKERKKEKKKDRKIDKTTTTTTYIHRKLYTCVLLYNDSLNYTDSLVIIIDVFQVVVESVMPYINQTFEDF